MFPCCVIDPTKSAFTGNKNINNLDDYFTSDYHKHIVNSLDNGIKIPECSTCWSKEKTNLQSFRQEENNNLLGGTKFTSKWINLLSKKQQTSSPLLFADLKFSNVCNIPVPCVIHTIALKYIHSGYLNQMHHILKNF
jgi:hypothetical protein